MLVVTDRDRKAWVWQLVTVQDSDFGDIAAVSAVTWVVRAGRERNEQEPLVSAGEALFKLSPGTPRNIGRNIKGLEDLQARYGWSQRPHNLNITYEDTLAKFSFFLTSNKKF